jgi:hypothetical protein
VVSGVNAGLEASDRTQWFEESRVEESRVEEYGKLFDIMGGGTT